MLENITLQKPRTLRETLDFLQVDLDTCTYMLVVPTDIGAHDTAVAFGGTSESLKIYTRMLLDALARNIAQSQLENHSEQH